MNFNYSELSLKLTKSITKNDKKKEGIYFTPPNTIKNNIDYIKEILNFEAKNILEPSCGSCEYINILKNTYPESNILGIEYNEKIFDEIKNLYENNNKINIINEDYINYNFVNQKFDLIIGNPPFFVINKDEVENEYKQFFKCRPNIFILFIIKSLNLLLPNGILSFILPKNFLNTHYYDKTREYIYKNYYIMNIIECNDKYLDTQQDTVIFILQNITQISHQNRIENNDKYIIKKNNYTIFGLKDKMIRIKELYNNSKTLRELGFEASIGRIVWNECKPILTNNDDDTLLIYSSDISINNELIIKNYKNLNKKNYISYHGMEEPCVIINRGYGNAKYKFNYCLVNLDKPYQLENHIIFIIYTNSNLNNNELVEKYNKLISSFDDERTKEFVKLYFENNAINITEMNNILPIYNF